MIIEQQLKIDYEITQYIIFSFRFIKSKNTSAQAQAHEIKKIMLTIKLIFHYQLK